MVITVLQALPPMPGPATLPPAPLSFTDIIAVLFTALGVILTAAALIVAGVGVTIGVLAFWGYRTFEEKIREHANAAARNTTLEFVQSDEAKRILKAEAEGIISTLFDQWRESQEIAASQPPQTASTMVDAEATQKVGRPRRKKGVPHDGRRD